MSSGLSYIDALPYIRYCSSMGPISSTNILSRSFFLPSSAATYWLDVMMRWTRTYFEYFLAYSWQSGGVDPRKDRVTQAKLMRAREHFPVPQKVVSPSPPPHKTYLYINLANYVVKRLLFAFLLSLFNAINCATATRRILFEPLNMSHCYTTNLEETGFWAEFIVHGLWNSELKRDI